MKTLLCVFAFVLSLVPASAAVFKLDGDLTWEITEPRLTFRLVGKLQNLSPTGSTSGTIRMVLWATSVETPVRTHNIGEFTLGQIGGGYQFTDFNVRTNSKIPNISGTYRFSIAVMEYTTASWRNVVIVPTGNRSLIDGNFSEQKKWVLPPGKALTPPAKLRTGESFTLRLRATASKNLFPIGSQSRTTLDVKSATRIVSRIADSKRTPEYKYSVINETFKKKKVRAGQLTLTYPDSNSTITLFFQAPDSGTYKTVYESSGQSETTWGTFTFK